MNARLMLAVGSLLILSATGVAIAATTAPSPAITEVRLENPLNGDAKSFLDLDSGKTFPFSEYHKESFIRESGADIMCETRDPTEGFAAHGLTLVEIKTPFDQPPPYNEIVQQLSKVEPAHFAMMALKTFPATYLFRTQAGTLGVLEMTSADAAGLKLQYRIVTRPRESNRPFTQRRTPMAVRVQQAQMSVFLQTQRYGADHPSVRSAKSQLEILKKLAVLEEARNGIALLGINTDGLVDLYGKAMLRSRVTLTASQMKAVAEARNAEIEQMQLRIRIKASEQPQRRPTTSFTR